jgi:hypothetical protein
MKIADRNTTLRNRVRSANAVARNLLGAGRCVGSVQRIGGKIEEGVVRAMCRLPSHPRLHSRCRTGLLPEYLFTGYREPPGGNRGPAGGGRRRLWRHLNEGALDTAATYYEEETGKNDEQAEGEPQSREMFY